MERTYGRGSGERKFHPIPLYKYRRRERITMYDPYHTKYPLTGAYAEQEPEIKAENRINS